MLQCLKTRLTLTCRWPVKGLPKRTILVLSFFLLSSSSSFRSQVLMYPELSLNWHVTKDDWLLILLPLPSQCWNHRLHSKCSGGDWTQCLVHARHTSPTELQLEPRILHLKKKFNYVYYACVWVSQLCPSITWDSRQNTGCPHPQKGSLPTKPAIWPQEC